MANLNFKKGLYENLPLSKNAGTVYVTTDTRSMYVDVSDTERIMIQGSVLYYDNLESFTAGTKPPYDSNLIYFIADENALVRWDPNKIIENSDETGGWVQLNATVDSLNDVIDAVNTNTASLGSLTTQVDLLVKDVDALETAVGAPAEGETAATGLFKDVADNTAAISGLTTRVASAESNISALQESVKKFDTIEGELGNINTQLDSHSEAIEKLETAVDGKADASTVTTLSGEVSDLKGVVDGHTTTIETLATKEALNATNSTVAGLETQIDGINLNLDKKVDKEDGKFLMTQDERDKLAGIADGANNIVVDDALKVSSTNPVQNKVVATKINELVNADANLTTQIDGINTALSGKVDKVDGYSLMSAAEHTKLEGIEAGANKTVVDDKLDANSVNPVQNKVVAGLSTTVSNLQTQVDGIVEDLGDYVTKTEYNEKVAELEGDIDAINDILGGDSGSSFNERVTALETWKGTATDQITALQNKDSDLETQIDAVTSTANLNKSDIAALTTKVDTNTSNIGTLTTKVNTNTSNITALDTRVTQAEKDIEANESAIGDLQSIIDETMATKDELSAVESTINEKILAANAMTYKGGVGSTTELNAITKPSAGDTYVVTQGFGSYQAGDLLIATGTENADGVLDTFTWTVVDTGYIQEHEANLSVSGESIVLTSYTGINLGAVSITGSENVTITASGDAINVGMVWGEF